MEDYEVGCFHFYLSHFGVVFPLEVFK